MKYIIGFVIGVCFMGALLANPKEECGIDINKALKSGGLTLD